MKPTYFKSQADFRAWLEKNHATVKELWVGFYKKASGKGGLQYLEAVDEALCVGWIDGIKKRVDEASFTHRFTPRTKRSSWSLINTKRVAYLKKRGLVTPAGQKAFDERDRKRSGIYLYEQRLQPLAPAYEREFRQHADAWAFFQSQAPGYRKLLTMFIMTAKKEETRLKRLAMVIKACAERKKWTAM